jgi:hypothetical protein
LAIVATPQSRSIFPAGAEPCPRQESRIRINTGLDSQKETVCASRKNNTHPNVKFQIISLTSKMASQTSIAIHAKVMTTMAPIMTPRIIVPTARLKTPADEIGGV